MSECGGGQKEGGGGSRGGSNIKVNLIYQDGGGPRGCFLFFVDQQNALV